MTFESAFMLTCGILVAVLMVVAVVGIVGTSFYEVFWKGESQDPRPGMVVLATFIAVGLGILTTLVWIIGNSL